MAYVVNVSAKNLGKINLKRAVTFRKELQRTLKSASKKMLTDLRGRTRSEKKVDLGGIYRGWRADVALVDDMKIDLWNDAPHHIYVEFGRAAGRKMPPVSVISAWCERKLGDATLGWAVAKTIAKYGIPPTRMMTSPEFQRYARQLFKAAVKEATGRSIVVVTGGRVD